MLSAATNDRARALRRRRGAISGSYEDDRKEFNSVDDSGYDGEDNLELTHHFSDLPNATSPESYFTSADNEEQTFHSELTEPVARKRAKKACDYCRAKKCKCTGEPQCAECRKSQQFCHFSLYTGTSDINSEKDIIIRGQAEKITVLDWALKEYHARMFANLGPVAGPRNFTDVIPWLQGDPINGPPPLCLSVQQPNGVLDSNGPVRRHRRNSARNRGRRQNRQRSSQTDAFSNMEPGGKQEELHCPLPAPNYLRRAAGGESNIPGARLDVETSFTPSTLDTTFTATGQVSSPIVTNFAFSPEAMFPTSSSFGTQATTSATGAVYGHYNIENQYYGPDSDWQHNANVHTVLGENPSSYYYTPTERGQPGQYDNRDRSSPPELQYYSYDPNNPNQSF